MALREFKGNAIPTTLVSGINASVLTFDIAATTGWPTGGVNGKFWVVINTGEATEEKILCLSRSGSTITVDTGNRGQDDTAAAIHSAGESVVHCYSATDAREANEHINNPALDHHSQYMLASGVRHDLTARHAAGTVVPTATPVAIGTVLTEGAGTTLARSSHVHTIGAGAINNSNMFSAGIVNAAAIGTDQVGTDELAPLSVTNAEIADTTLLSGKLAAGIYGSPVEVGDANGDGAAATLARSNHTHLVRQGRQITAPVRRTSDQIGLGSAMTDFAGMAITGTVAANRYVRVRVHMYIQGNIAASNYSGVIREGSTTLGKFGWFRAHVNSESAVLEGSVLLTAPSAGPHTYKASMESTGGSTFDHLASVDEGRIELIDEGSTV